MKKQTKQKKLKTLTEWDWDTLPAAWRYYEYRQTIASATFPAQIIERFFGSDYDEESKVRIAHQFAHVDHGLRGEEDWADNQYTMDCDKKAWCKFYAFCKAWCDGFAVINVDDGEGGIKQMEAFYCEFTKRWHPKEYYQSFPRREIWIPDERIKLEVTK